MAGAVALRKAKLIAICTGRSSEIAPGVPSAIGKTPIEKPVRITKLGLEGDQQADLVSHGGVHQAVHHYPSEHHARWRRDFPASASAFRPGGVGENFSTAGITDSDICIGDVVTVGSATLEVSQGRMPCVKLTYRIGEPGVLRNFVRKGRTGWYYRVIDEGSVSPDDSCSILSRPNPGWTVRRVVQLVVGSQPQLEGEIESFPHDLAQVCDLRQLSPHWKDFAHRRLQLFNQSHRA